MNNFINDMFEMREGEKFIKYWWMWVIILIVGLIVAELANKTSKTKNDGV